MGRKRRKYIKEGDVLDIFSVFLNILRVDGNIISFVFFIFFMLFVRFMSGFILLYFLVCVCLSFFRCHFP